MSKSIHQRRSQLQERRAAESLGGRVQKGSGSSDFAKGDVRAPDLRVECKTTSFTSYSLKLSEWKKIMKEAITGNLDRAAMQIEFQGQFGQNTKLAVIAWQDFLDLIQNYHSPGACENHRMPDAGCMMCKEKSNVP
jgi:hypothetical protein